MAYLTDEEVRALAIDFAKMIVNRKKLTNPQEMIQEFFDQIDTLLDELTKQNDKRKPVEPEPHVDVQIPGVDATPPGKNPSVKW